MMPVLVCLGSMGQELKVWMDIPVMVADGQTVWVHRQNTLEHGQIGIFLYDGCAYCKRLEQDSRGLRLCSLNPAYAPIVLRPGEELTVFGRVVG